MDTPLEVAQVARPDDRLELLRARRDDPARQRRHAGAAADRADPGRRRDCVRHPGVTKQVDGQPGQPAGGRPRLRVRLRVHDRPDRQPASRPWSSRARSTIKDGQSADVDRASLPVRSARSGRPTPRAASRNHPAERPRRRHDRPRSSARRPAVAGGDHQQRVPAGVARDHQGRSTGAAARVRRRHDVPRRGDLRVGRGHRARLPDDRASWSATTRETHRRAGRRDLHRRRARRRWRDLLDGHARRRRR